MCLSMHALLERCSAHWGALAPVKYVVGPRVPILWSYAHAQSESLAAIVWRRDLWKTWCRSRHRQWNTVFWYVIARLKYAVSLTSFLKCLLLMITMIHVLRVWRYRSRRWKLLLSADNSDLISSAVAKRLDKLCNLSLKVSYPYFVQICLQYFAMLLNKNVSLFALNKAD